MIAAYPSPREYFVQRVAEGVSIIAAAFAPEPVIVRMSDFKSNEYAKLVGGEQYEPDEENPMIGWRGASRYLAEDFAECFAMECAALKHVRDEMGLTNVKIMIPFVRTLTEAKGVIDLLASHGLRRGENGLQVVMMCELPSNAVIAEQFLEHFDGFSIGSNDMTQLTLGLDRDSGLVADKFDERDPAVLHMLSFTVKTVLVFSLLRAVGRRLEPLSGGRMSFLCFRLFVPLAIVNVFATGYWLVARPGL